MHCGKKSKVCLSLQILTAVLWKVLNTRNDQIVSTKHYVNHIGDLEQDKKIHEVLMGSKKKTNVPSQDIQDHTTGDAEQTNSVKKNGGFNITSVDKIQKGSIEKPKHKGQPFKGGNKVNTVSYATDVIEIDDDDDDDENDVEDVKDWQEKDEENDEENKEDLQIKESVKNEKLEETIGIKTGNDNDSVDVYKNDGTNEEEADYFDMDCEEINESDSEDNEEEYEEEAPTKQDGDHVRSKFEKLLESEKQRVEEMAVTVISDDDEADNVVDKSRNKSKSKAEKNSKGSVETRATRGRSNQKNLAQVAKEPRTALDIIKERVKKLGSLTKPHEDVICIDHNLRKKVKRAVRSVTDELVSDEVIIDNVAKKGPSTSQSLSNSDQSESETAKALGLIPSHPQSVAKALPLTRVVSCEEVPLMPEVVLDHDEDMQVDDTQVN